jgi:hypothetical protein
MTAPAFHPLPRSPDFQGKQGHASRFARKGSKLRLVWPGYDDTEVVEPDEVVNYRAQAGLRVGGGSARKHCPLVKIETPSTPPFSPPTGAALVHRPVRFSPSFFERSSRATAPPLCVTAPGRLYLLVVWSRQDNCLISNELSRWKPIACKPFGRTSSRS